MVEGRVTRADVEDVAALGRLAVDDDEVEELAEQLSAILEHAAAVSALDTAGVPPTAHPFPLSNVLRPDELGPSLERADVLAEAPEAEDGRFRVPRIMGEEP